jgi:hypothetical protein
MWTFSAILKSTLVAVVTQNTITLWEPFLFQLAHYCVTASTQSITMLRSTAFDVIQG